MTRGSWVTTPSAFLIVFKTRLEAPEMPQLSSYPYTYQLLSVWPPSLLRHAFHACLFHALQCRALTYLGDTLQILL